MIENAQWIWVPQHACPHLRETAVSVFDPKAEKTPFAVVQCKKTIVSTTAIRQIRIEICADVKFRLFINGKLVGIGPVCSGGDYGNALPMPVRYYNRYTVNADSDTVEILAEVQNKPSVQCDMSQGRPGLIAAVETTDENGKTDTCCTDESWQVRVGARYAAVDRLDDTVPENAWTAAEPVQIGVPLRESPIEMLCLEDCAPSGFESFTVLPGETKEITVEWDYVYSLYYRFCVRATDTFLLKLSDYERYESQAKIAETVVGKRDICFESLSMHSASAAIVTLQNTGKAPVTLADFSAIFVHYPFRGEGKFICSDEKLNALYNLGKHTLRICRQTIELDSPKHQENLGCTGDYYIASLMNYMADGDIALSKADLIRTAHYLEMTDGRLFHTTYSMLWIQMLFDCYQFSGEEELLHICLPALKVLLHRFAGYVGERGIIDRAPNYMFLDWLTVDGYAMHHPPMALGQTALNAFYYGGLQTARKIFEILGESAWAADCTARAARLKTAFQKYFYDAERGLFFDGLNEDCSPNDWLPANSKKRYFSIHANALAVLYGLVEGEPAKRMMQTVLSDDEMAVPQPYFMHFVLNALDCVGLFDSLGMQQLKRWNCMTEFKKGLQEGWDTGCGGYVFDYSHVWGGTPTYQLPQKLLGLEMVEPGWKKVRIRPRLCGLDFADITVPTPYGNICAALSKRDGIAVKLPPEIALAEPIPTAFEA